MKRAAGSLAAQYSMRYYFKRSAGSPDCSAFHCGCSELHVYAREPQRGMDGRENGIQGSVRPW